MATERKSAEHGAQQQKLKCAASVPVRPPAALAKISGPRIGQRIYPRERLFHWLDDARRLHAIIWIQAPAGSGKTMLVASYLDARKTSTLWYQMDTGDADIASFFYYMGLAATRIAPRKALPFLTQEYLAGLQVFTRNYFRQLFSKLKPPGVVVLDNYQDVSADSRMHGLLEYGLQEIPTDITVIILSRLPPPAAFSRLRVGGSMTGLSWVDLRLTEEESMGIATLHDQSRRSRHDVSELYIRTQGWAAGLTLMLEHSSRHPQAPYLGSSEDGQTMLFDYFAAEVFRRAEPSVQEFLLKTAFLPKISVAAAQRLTGETNAERILNNLVRRNYFTVRQNAIDGVYEYHPLFHAFLTNCATVQYNPGEIQCLKRKCAQLLIESGDVDTAISLLLQVEDWLGAAKVILDQARVLVEQGRTQTLMKWLLALPQTLRDGDPWALYWLGICHLLYSPCEARCYFERAFALFEGQDDASPLYLSWSRIIDSYVIEWNDFKPMDKWLDAYHSLGQQRKPPLPGIEAASIFSYLEGLIHRRPDHPDLHSCAERAEILFLQLMDVNRRFTTGAPLILYYIWKGKLDKADYLLQSLSVHPGTGAIQPPTQIIWYFLKSLHASLAGSPLECLRAAHDALELSKACGVHAFAPLVLGDGMCGHLQLGDMNAAREWAGQLAQSVAGRPQVYQAFCHCCHTRLFLHEGHIARAIQEGTHAVYLFRASGMIFGEAQSRLALAYALAKHGDMQGALREIEAARAIGARMDSNLIRYECAITEAGIRRMMEESSAALRLLDQAMELGVETGIVNIMPWYRREEYALLCSLALDEGIRPSVVRTIIAKTGLPPPPGVLSEHWPWPVRIYTLGRFAVVRHGSTLHFDVKAQRRPLEMLKALVAFGGRNVSEEMLTEALWPDAEGDAGHQVFATTLHRLRKLLGIDNAIHQEDKRLTLDAHCVWVDVWAFERALSQDAIGDQHPERTRQLYRGNFLAGEMQSWAIALRERLHSKFLRMVVHHGSNLEQAGQWCEAAAWYQHGLDTDPLAEELYRSLIRCYVRLGRLTEARIIYDQCRGILTQLLGVEPSPETKELWRLAQNGQPSAFFDKKATK